MQGEQNTTQTVFNTLQRRTDLESARREELLRAWNITSQETVWDSIKAK